MMTNNKILTVSYGTFSCTLEGFEDSFDTMKSIAEYFRDLAQDDRYFGAEPPQPDAEMLARIAERDIERRVEARMSDGNVHLRAAGAGAALVAAPAAAAAVALSDDSEDALDDTPVSVADAPEADVEDAADTTVIDTLDADAAIAAALQTDAEPAAEMNEEEVLAVEDDPVQADVEDALEDTLDVAEDLQPAVEAEPMSEMAEAQEDTLDIAAVLAASEPPEAIVEEPEAEPEYMETTEDNGDEDDTHASILSALMDEADAPDLAQDDDLTDDAGLDAAADDLNTEIDAFAAMMDTSEAEPVDPPVTDDVPNSIAAKLQRIRDVVAKNKAAGSEYSEDEHVDEVFAGPEADTQDADEDAETALEAMAAELAADEMIFDLSEDTMESDEDALDDDIGDDMAEADVSDDLAALVSELEGSVEDAQSTDALDEAAPDLTSDEGDAAPAPRGRVISVKRADLDAAMQQGLIEPVAEDDISAEDVEAIAEMSFDTEAEAEAEPEADAEDLAAQSSLSDEDEADLLRELAEVEAELPQSDDDEAAQAFEEVGGTEEAELDRLMAEADSQMQEPESTSRRDAFSHLRAAVAATKADDKLEEEATATEDDGDYRTDLAAAVRPRRPVAGGEGRSERPRARPAPLKLVAEQRIDTDAAPSGPVRPRRIAAAELVADADDTGSFADYATAQGATELQDLLEAAASYLSFVEGREQFSRPQLMTKVRQAGPDMFSREDGLRSFGQLLRTGKIEKIKGGRFTVSDDIGFRPDERAAG